MCIYIILVLYYEATGDVMFLLLYVTLFVVKITSVLQF